MRKLFMWLLEVVARGSVNSGGYRRSRKVWWGG